MLCAERRNISPDVTGELLSWRAGSQWDSARNKMRVRVFTGHQKENMAKADKRKERSRQAPGWSLRCWQRRCWSFTESFVDAAVSACHEQLISAVEPASDLPPGVGLRRPADSRLPRHGSLPPKIMLQPRERFCDPCTGETNGE